MDMAELLSDARKRGFQRSFSCDGTVLRCRNSGECFEADAAWIVDSRSVDQGTDPGDDATIYLIDTTTGARGYVIVSDSFHADPATASFLDRMPRHEPTKV